MVLPEGDGAWRHVCSKCGYTDCELRSCLAAPCVHLQLSFMAGVACMHAPFNHLSPLRCTLQTSTPSSSSGPS